MNGELTGVAAGSLRRSIALGALLAVLTAAVFWGSFSGVFVFDDVEGIVQNQTIRKLWPLTGVLSPPGNEGQTVGSRPLVNLTLALNYAAGGLDPAGYHAVNLVIHLCAALALFGIVRRTLAAVRRGAVTGDPRGDWIAFGAALLWAVHPLQTESVTYVIQRAESLMGLFYLLTLYGFIRGASQGREDAKGRAVWLSLSVVSCFLGMATKEVMVSAPVMVLLYDRIFASGSFAGALRRNGKYYAGLAASWLLLAGLFLSNRNRGGSMGFGIGVGIGEYALTQFPAIAHYLRLAIWPSPLIFDYGAEWIDRPWSVFPAALLVLALAAASAAGAWRGKGWGFAGIFFFAILAPTSLVPANRQTISEHRMYLALAPLAVCAVLALDAGLRRALRNRESSRILAVALLAVGAALGIATVRRNEVYRSELALYADTAAKRPLNAHAHQNLGKALAQAGSLTEAKAAFVRALGIDPDLPDAHANLGNVLVAEGAVAEAIPHYEAALRLGLPRAEIHYNLGGALVHVGRVEEGMDHYREAIRMNPDHEGAHYNLATILAGLGRLADAAAEFTEALRIQPGNTDARWNFSLLLYELNRTADAIQLLQDGLRMKPDSADLHTGLGLMFARQGRYTESRAEFQRALAIQPDLPSARDFLKRLDATPGAGP